MADQTILNYEELQRFSKVFQQESEEYAELNSRTRQMVHDLEDDWIGLGADKFFEEAETVLLPALQRLQQALLFTSETCQSVMKTFQVAEEESADYFKDGQLESGDGLGGDFGAGAFRSVIDGATPGAGGTQPGDLSDLDFGLGDLGAGGSGGSGDTGDTGGTQEAGGSPPSQSESGGSGSQQESQTPETSQAGGGGGSSGGSQGLQGDLKEMGTGSSRQGGGAVGTSGGSSSSGAMPDHVYQSSSSGGGGASSSPSSSTSSPPASGGEGGDQGSLGKAAGAAGALGGLGAAAGAAKKALQGDDDDEE